MRIEDQSVIFDNLVRPSEDLVGDTKPVRAKVPEFSAPNAKGMLREVADFQEVGKIGLATGQSFRQRMIS